MFDSISDIESTDQVLLAWTLSPEKVVNKNELDTPPLIKRLKAVQKAIKKGWRVRLCFDPILLYSDWEKDYLDLLNQIKSEISFNEIFDITVGVFRMGQDYFNRIRKTKPESKLYYQKYINDAGVITVSQSDREAVEVFVRENLSGFIPEDRIHFWD
jgi:spore photoproduct lyase